MDRTKPRSGPCSARDRPLFEAASITSGNDRGETELPFRSLEGPRRKPTQHSAGVHQRLDGSGIAHATLKDVVPEYKPRQIKPRGRPTGRLASPLPYLDS